MSAMCVPIRIRLLGASFLHLHHPVVLTLASFSVGFKAFVSVSNTVTYCLEYFTHYAAKASINIDFYRLLLETMTRYFITPWVVAVGIQWAFGISAFLVLGPLGLVVLMMFKGESIRQMQFAGLLHLK